MAWIQDELDGMTDHPSEDLTKLWAQAVDPDTGEVDNILKVHALHPAGLSAHLALYRAVMAGTKTLRKIEREMIALVVSQLNECHY